MTQTRRPATTWHPIDDELMVGIIRCQPDDTETYTKHLAELLNHIGADDDSLWAAPTWGRYRTIPCQHDREHSWDLKSADTAGQGVFWAAPVRDLRQAEEYERYTRRRAEARSQQGAQS